VRSACWLRGETELWLRPWSSVLLEAGLRSVRCEALLPSQVLRQRLLERLCEQGLCGSGRLCGSRSDLCGSGSDLRCSGSDLRRSRSFVRLR